MKWVEELRRYLPEATPIAIAGNKCDMESSRIIDNDEAREYAAKVRGAHFDTSAKTGKGISELFEALTKAIIRKEKKEAKNKQKESTKKTKKQLGVEGYDGELGLGKIGGGGGSGYGGMRLSTVAPKERKEKKKKCCSD